MQHRAALSYTPSLVRLAVLGFWWRVVGLQYVLAIVLLAIALTVLIGGGDRSWVVGVVATALAIGTAFPVALYVVHYRAAFQRLKATGNGRAELTASESSLCLASAAGTASYPWREIREVWRFPDFWLLLFSKAQFATLPLDDAPSELQAFILERVRETGGKVA